MRGTLASLIALALGASPAGAQLTVGQPVVLEGFEDARLYSAVPSDGVLLSLRPDEGITGRSLRLDYDFQNHAGYAVARRRFSLPPLSPNWSLSLWVRGDARPNTLELKLVDASGQNVWWMRRPDLRVGPGWTELRFRPADLSFAWGPLGGGPPRDVAALEIAFTAGAGGKGWLGLDQLVLTPLPMPVSDSVRPRVAASSSVRGAVPASVVGPRFAEAPRFSPAPRAATRGGWRSAGDGDQWLTLDFGGPRALSGLVLDWSDADFPVDYSVLYSNDGRTWTVAKAVLGNGGGRRFVHLPDLETSQLRLALRKSSRGQGYALRDLRVLGATAAPTTTAFLERIAAASAPGSWPRPLTGQQSYWTVIGIPRDERDALFSEDGNVESRPGGFSVEPFLYTSGKLLTWRDGITSHSLDGGSRPIPTSKRVAEGLALETTAFADGTPGHSVVWVRYALTNLRAARRAVQLYAAVRPVQVNPPWQFLGTPGGAAMIRGIRWDGHALLVNGIDRVVPITTPSGFGASRFQRGPIVDFLRRGALPGNASESDTTGLVDGALSWRIALAPRARAEVWLALPAPDSSVATASLPIVTTASEASRLGAARLDGARAAWDRELGAVQVELPGSGAPLARTLRSALAYVLINARGAAIQPGTRSYRRSWIRDGALTSSALMRLGHAADARAFLDWYLPNVFASGKTPCCVDARGADPVTENDADGELLYLAAEHFRMTGDTATVRRHWPTLAKVAAHLDSLRESRRTAQYRTPDSLFVFGLLPPSISHEGYSAKPAYSYWDDWWGVRGLDDAGLLARIAGDSAASARFANAGREMRRDVVASVARSMKMHGQETLPGAAELGDTDPTSSTMALEPAQALGDLPRAAVLATFDSAWATLGRRRLPDRKWDVYTPYEWRDVGAFIRLGQPARAHEYARWLLESRRPREWNQWSEAVWREPRAPKFIGDMPHGWVMSDFARATLDMIAYEREPDSVLVVGAGIPIAWARDPAGVRVRDLHTWWGPLSLDVRPSGSAVRVTVGGVDPPGGIELHVPFGTSPRRIRVNGKPAAMTDGGRAVMIRAPAVVELSY